jgi:hypothetical protein
MRFAVPVCYREAGEGMTSIPIRTYHNTLPPFFETMEQFMDGDFEFFAAAIMPVSFRRGGHDVPFAAARWAR